MHGSIGRPHHHHPHPHPEDSHYHRGGSGHNHSPDADHLHSHVHGGTDRERQDELATLATSFVKGFRSAEDKTSFLRLAGVPFALTGSDGLKMHLVDTAITSNWQIGTASPAFGTRELVYLPYPGEMVRERETMTFTYVSLTERKDVELVKWLSERPTASG